MARSMKVLCALALALPACDGFDDERASVLTAPTTGGPNIVFALDAPQLPPDAPFPNDVFTRPDPRSPTGRRITLPSALPTGPERALARALSSWDGFAVDGAITARFDRDIDVEDLRARQEDTLRTNDAVLLMVVDPDSPYRGEVVPLDFGARVALPDALKIDPAQRAPQTGRFPVVAGRGFELFDHDPRAGASSLFFETWNEVDLDGDGLLDPTEDTDGDGVHDRPNTLDGVPLSPGTQAEADALIPFYDFETHTLYIRPLVALREGTTYAVVFSRFLKDTEGRAVRSPFDVVFHHDQAAVLGELKTLLPPAGMNVEDVAFAWSFTTGYPTTGLADVWRWFQGEGPLVRAPGRPATVRFDGHAWSDEETELGGEALNALVDGAMTLAGATDAQRAATVDSFRFVDGLMLGTLLAPEVVDPVSGHFAPAFDGGADRLVEVEVWCTKPKAGQYVDRDGEAHQIAAPFPVVIYAHDHFKNRMAMLAHAGDHARLGFATCALDAVNHGFVATAATEAAFADLLSSPGVDRERVLANLVGRARDVDLDGVADPRAGLLAADPLTSAGAILQTASDNLALVEALKRGGDWAMLGGADADFFVWGEGLGGTVATMVGASDPSIVAVAPVAPQAGLWAGALSSADPALQATAALPALGPVLVGDAKLEDPGSYDLAWLVPGADGRPVRRVFATVRLDEGDVLALVNEADLVASAAEGAAALPSPHLATVQSDVGFRVSVAASALTAGARTEALGLRVGEATTLSDAQVRAAGDGLRLEIYSAGRYDAPRQVIDRLEHELTYRGATFPVDSPLVALSPGWGVARQSAALRRLQGLVRWAMGPADAGAWAPRLLARPHDFTLITTRTITETRAMIYATPGDQIAPIANTLHVARAAGLINFERRRADLYGLTEDQMLLATGVYEGAVAYGRWRDDLGWFNFDIDDLDGYNGGLLPQGGALRLRLWGATPEGGVSGVRFPYRARSDYGDTHGIGHADPSGGFDVGTFTANQIGLFFLRRAERLSAEEIDQPCLAFGGDSLAACLFLRLYPYRE